MTEIKDKASTKTCTPSKKEPVAKMADQPIAEIVTKTSTSQAESTKDAGTDTDQAPQSENPAIVDASTEQAGQVPQAEATPVDDEYMAIAHNYSKHYPDCKQFHITGDKMVFLESDYQLALQHQSTQSQGQLHSITVQ